ncbi:MAG: substrate-binding domain-containing protein, partial [Candidatus Acidoferrales bacterium]
GLAKRQTHTIGMIVPDIANPFFPQVVRGAEDEAQKDGYSILLCNSDDKQEKEELYLELLLSKRVDGILLTKTPGRFSPRLQQMLADVKVPMVLLMRTAPGVQADTAVTDDLKGAFEAVSHLARVGHRTIALVSGPLHVSNAKARWQGFRKALGINGLHYDPALVVEGDYRIDSGYRAGLTLLPRRPEAIFVANYLMTVGLLKAAEEMRMRCPEDFALASFDDYPWLGFFRPRLTTVELPKYELGVTAAQMLLERIAGKRGRPRTRKLMPQLSVRDSCGFTQHVRKLAAVKKAH